MHINHPFSLLDVLADQEPALQGPARLGRLLGRIGWYRALGAPLDAGTMALADDWLGALGLVDATPALTESAEEAAELLTQAREGSRLSRQEAQLRDALVLDMTQGMGEPALLFEALDVIKGLAAVTAGRAIEQDGVFPPHADPILLGAAVGAATQAAVDAALVLTAGAGPEHPLARRFALFERGRWPLCLIGATLHLY